MSCDISSTILCDKKSNRICSTDKVQITLILRTTTERRCGKDYLIINEVVPGASSSVSAAHSEIDFKYDDAHSAVNSLINRVANSKFQTCKGMMGHSLDAFIGEIYKTIFVRVFDKMAIQDFFVCNK